MKKNNRALSGLALAVAAVLCAGRAAAQGVTIGGIADAAVRRVDNSGGGAVDSLVSGSNATSRIVIRGTDDLGGGLWAGFWLEHGLLLDTGAPAQATQFWDRRSTVSIGGERFGELRLGRDFVPSYVNWSRYDPFAYVGAAGSNNLVSAAQSGPIRAAFSSSPNTTVRSSNAAQWLLPSGRGGLEGGVMLAAREGGRAADGQHRVVGARLGWAAGAFGVSAATTRSRNDLTGSERFVDDAVGGNADFGVVRLSAAWRRFELSGARQTNVIVGAWVPIGVGELKASWTRANLSGRVGNAAIDANGATQTGLGYVHNLSKRSALYATVSRVRNRGVATFAMPGGTTMIAGGSSTGVEVGVRHGF